MARQQARQSLAAAIRAKGYDWTETSEGLAAASKEEQKGHLGLVVSKAELAATAQAIQAAERLSAAQLAASPGLMAAPAAIDWRNNGGNWVTPIKDQKNCGSCVSFATAATIESAVRIACRNAQLAIDLAEAQLFFCGCGNCCATGWNFAPALDFAKNTGVVKESDFPYTPNNQPCKAGLTPWFKISSWAQHLSIVQRKDALTRGPVVAGMAVYQDFFSYRSGVYRHVTGGLAGYHAVSVVGYDDAQQCWIAKNSWGTGFGESGFFRIGYGQCGMDSQFAFYSVAAPCVAPRPVDPCLQYVAHLTAILRAAQTDLRLRRCLRFYVCRRGLKPPCSAAHLRIVSIANAILSRCPRLRPKFCAAIG